MTAVALAGRRAARATFSTLAAIGRLRTQPIVDPKGRAQRLSELFSDLCALHGFRLETSGCELPPPPFVLVTNHLSYLDPVVILSHMPCVPVAKASVGSWPMIGTVARALGVLLVDRVDPMSGAATLRRAVTALRAGVALLNFPEGTTTDGSEVLPFKRGIFGAARIARVPVVPAALRYESPDLTWTGDETFLPHYLKTAGRVSTVARVCFGRPLWPAPYLAAGEMAVCAREEILALLKGRSDEPTERVRVPSTRTDPVLSPAVSAALSA